MSGDHLDPRRRRRDRDDLPAALTVGKVTRVTADGAFLELPDLVRGAEYGPAAYPDVYRAGVAFDAAATGAAAVGDHGAHTHTVSRGLPPLTAGDTVLVAFVAVGAGPDPVIVARL